MPGIPLIERIVGKRIIAAHCRKNPPSDTLGIVRTQRDALAALTDAAADRATQRVQIKRLRGLEKSSTNWSLAMVADHLARTNADMARTIDQLVRDQQPDTEVVIAKYKPEPGATPDAAIADLDRSIDDLARALQDPAAIERATRTHPHPWFGPLTATTWACFPSFHQAVHLQQAHRIAADLR